MTSIIRDQTATFITNHNIPCDVRQNIPIPLFKSSDITEYSGSVRMKLTDPPMFLARAAAMSITSSTARSPTGIFKLEYDLSMIINIIIY